MWFPVSVIIKSSRLPWQVWHLACFIIGMCLRYSKMTGISRICPKSREKCLFARKWYEFRMISANWRNIRGYNQVCFVYSLFRGCITLITRRSRNRKRLWTGWEKLATIIFRNMGTLSTRLENIACYQRYCILRPTIIVILVRLLKHNTTKIEMYVRQNWSFTVSGWISLSLCQEFGAYIYRAVLASEIHFHLDLYTESTDFI